MNQEEILATLISWFTEQHRDSPGPFLPYVDCDRPEEAVLDGHFDLKQLAGVLATRSK